MCVEGDEKGALEIVMTGGGQGHFGIKRRKSAVLIATKGDSRRERAAGKVVRRVRAAKGREDTAVMKGCRERCVKIMVLRC